LARAAISSTHWISFSFFVGTVVVLTLLLCRLL
jgi:hypothetical protein